MSRCFPYPPPGYVKIGIRDQPQTESIKKEEEKARKDRKEEEKARKDRKEEEKAKKDRKKEKKREKKEKERAKEGKEVESKKHSHKKRHRDEKSKDSKGDDPQKRRKTELENSDKSTLTEEHEPAAGSQNSSDSTLNSNKRLKENSPPDSCLNSGVTVRIAPTSRHKDSKVQPIKEQPPSGLERINVVFDQQMDEAAPRPGKEPGDDPCSSSQTPRITLKLRKESPFQTSCASERSAGKTEETSTLKLTCASERSAGKAGETSTQKLPCASERSAGKAEGTSTPKLSCASERSAGKAEGSSTPKLCSICPPTLALQFKSLVEDWIQPPTESVGFEDQEWLSKTKRNPQPVVKRTELGITGSRRETSDHWPPRACHLPEVDIYALPFTIPF